MKTSRLHRAVWAVCLLTLTGCAASRPRPSGFSEQQMTESLSRLRWQCMGLKLGAPVSVTFYDGIAEKERSAKSGTQYFYAYNRWNDTISMSDQPPSFFSRGKPYFLTAIQSIAMVDVASARRNERVINEHEALPDQNPSLSQTLPQPPAPDYEHQLLHE